MSKTIYSSSTRTDNLVCQDLRARRDGPDTVSARQQGVPGFDQDALSGASILLIGAGGLNGEIGEGLVRKGVGSLTILDGDTVTLSNLNRQRFFADDIGENKASRLACNLRQEGFMGTEIVAYPYYFQEAIEKGFQFAPTLLVCGVDNDECRLYASEFAIHSGIPAIFFAVSRDANQAYVFVQLNRGPCFQCAFPQSLLNGSTPCPGVPAVKDILKVSAGIALYAIDTLIMKRQRNWNYRMVYLAGFLSDVKSSIARRSDCPVCGSAQPKGGL